MATEDRHLLGVHRHQQGDQVRLAVVGELDFTTAPLLIEALDAADALAPARIVVDLSGLDFLDCAGLPALLYGRARATARGAAYEVRGATGLPRTVLLLTGMLEYLSVLVV